jgi:predicted nucleic acid-binding Zn ribbon protein
MQGKKERSRRRLTFMMYLFPAIAVFFVILEVVGASG